MGHNGTRVCWITSDTARVALALARARIMRARYPYDLLADSREGQIKEAEVTRTAPSSQAVHGNIPTALSMSACSRIILKSIANNAEIDVSWEKWQEWEIPREVDKTWPEAAKKFPANGGRPVLPAKRKLTPPLLAKPSVNTAPRHPTKTRKRSGSQAPSSSKPLPTLRFFRR